MVPILAHLKKKTPNSLKMYPHTRLLNDSWKIEIESFFNIIFGRKFGENVEKTFR